jgi:hypothetical protein
MTGLAQLLGPFTHPVTELEGETLWLNAPLKYHVKPISE